MSRVPVGATSGNPRHHYIRLKLPFPTQSECPSRASPIASQPYHRSPHRLTIRWPGFKIARLPTGLTAFVKFLEGEINPDYSSRRRARRNTKNLQNILRAATVAIRCKMTPCQLPNRIFPGTVWFCMISQLHPCSTCLQGLSPRNGNRYFCSRGSGPYDPLSRNSTSFWRSWRQVYRIGVFSSFASLRSMALV